jgi:hypothetical protein
VFGDDDTIAVEVPVVNGYLYGASNQFDRVVWVEKR